MNNMDFFTKKEINTLKGEIIARDVAIEAEKYAFEQLLKNGLGEEIKKSFENPPKPSFWKKIKLKYSRWKQKRNELKEYKSIIKELDKINNDLKKELGGF